HRPPGQHRRIALGGRLDDPARRPVISLPSESSRGPIKLIGPLYLFGWRIPYRFPETASRAGNGAFQSSKREKYIVENFRRSLSRKRRRQLIQGHWQRS